MKILKFLLVIIFFCNFALTASCQTKAQSVDLVVKDCQTFLDKDDLSSASACYQKAMAANPEDAKQISSAGQKAIFRKCLELKDREEHKLSIICLEGLTELNSNSANIFLQLGDSYYQYYLQRYKTYNEKDFELLSKAEESIKRSVEINSEKAIARETYGEILNEKGDLNGALREHSYAVKLNPSSIRMLIELALIQEKTGNNDDAKVNYTKVLTVEPNNALTLYFLGKLCEKTGDTDKAIENYERLLKIRSNYDDAEQRLKTLKKKRDLEKSENSKMKAAGN